MLKIAETPELTGHLIWALFNDPGPHGEERPDADRR